jgi:uncharacterized protein YjbJ (UPF0337 family)
MICSGLSQPACRNKRNGTKNGAKRYLFGSLPNIVATIDGDEDDDQHHFVDYPGIASYRRAAKLGLQPILGLWALGNIGPSAGRRRHSGTYGTRVTRPLAPKRRCNAIFQFKEVMMNWNRIEGNWTEFKGKVKQQWGKLTDDDIDVVNGRREELEGIIQKRYGYAKDKASQDVDTWLKDYQ